MSKILKNKKAKSKRWNSEKVLYSENRAKYLYTTLI